MVRRGPANVAGDYVAEFKATNAKHWTPMNEPTTDEACRRLIADCRRGGNVRDIAYRIRNVTKGDTETP